MKLNIRTKLLLSFGCVLALSAFMGGMAHLQLSNIAQKFKVITGVTGPTIEMVNDLVATTWKANKVAEAVLAQSDLTKIAPLDQEAQDLLKQWDETYQALNQVVAADRAGENIAATLDAAAQQRKVFEQNYQSMSAAHNQELQRMQDMDTLLNQYAELLKQLQPHLKTIGGINGRGVEVTVAEMDTMATEILKEHDAAILPELKKQYQTQIDTRDGFLRLVDDAELVDLLAQQDNVVTGPGGLFETYTSQISSENQSDQAVAQLEASAEGVVNNLESIAQTAEAANAAADLAVNQQINGATALLISVFAVSLILGLFLAFYIANNISGAARQMVAAARGIARGDMDQRITVRSQDEMGELAAAFQQMESYIQSMAQSADRLADGDLTVTVDALSDRDVLGNAFHKMIQRLRQLIANLAQDGVQLGSASEQLALSAEQSSQAAAQIAQTIQQVTRGIEQQTESVSLTSSSSEQMARAIEGVSQGAQEQSAAVEQASTLTTQITDAIKQVSVSAKTQAENAADAVKTSRASAATVQETVDGMQKIRAKVSLSVQKVQEMGSRSDQIGAIVETISDIAGQTNLLALNAAIEAARAGEHGKGFAVVADEVRKLPENSPQATKKISALIHAIQQTVDDAMQTMNESAGVVENGVRLANQSGQSLVSLLKNAEISQESGEEIAAAAEEMIYMADELVQAMDRVSAVVEENTAATQQMAASSTVVSDALANIVSVSEENSAAVEEVSAGAEEVNAQIEGVTDSAQSLAAMAHGLQEQVMLFRLN